MNRQILFFSLLICALFSLLWVPLGSPSETSHGRVESVSVSPDGKTIAVDFVREKTSHIFLIALDTGNATRLINDNKGGESDLSFSPDGKRIAYTYLPLDGGHSQIMVGNADGSDHAWLPSEDGVRDFSPVFSPDNKTVVFARSRYYGNYSPIAQPHYHAWDFYEADVDGTNIRQLTNKSFYSTSRPSISPDGKSMAVVTETNDSPEQISIYGLDHAEKPIRVLRPRVPGHDQRIYNCPNFMPDGKSILFLAATEGSRYFDYDVYRLDLETGAVEKLTKRNGYATDLRVFADGKTAAFLKWRSDRQATPVESDLYLLDMQSHNVTPVKVNGLD